MRNSGPVSGNLFASVPSQLAEEQFLDLAAGLGVRIARIVSTGHTTEWQHPAEDEWVLVLRGAGRLRFETGDEVLSMGPGDWCHIPAGLRHRVEWTDPDAPTVWLAVHFPPGGAA
ncbi:MAG: cupin domain-containing protein [Alphaproteobacteria bacterium]|nr:cupin domain-containing protein [Alphaproteobacteria bacterium]